LGLPFNPLCQLMSFDGGVEAININVNIAIL
jgi:hypothetical protein